MKYILILLVSCLIYSASSAQVTYRKIKGDIQSRYISSKGDTVPIQYKFILYDSIHRKVAWQELGWGDTVVIDIKGWLNHLDSLKKKKP